MSFTFAMPFLIFYRLLESEDGEYNLNVCQDKDIGNKDVVPIDEEDDEPILDIAVDKKLIDI
jgi:hypothetical protein